MRCIICLFVYHCISGSQCCEQSNENEQNLFSQFGQFRSVCRWAALVLFLSQISVVFLYKFEFETEKFFYQSYSITFVQFHLKGIMIPWEGPFESKSSSGLSLLPLGFWQLREQVNLTRGLYYKTFYGSICCRIIIS